MSLPNEVVVSTSKLTALGDAVRSRFGVSGELTLDEMATDIEDCKSGSGVISYGDNSSGKLLLPSGYGIVKNSSTTGHFRLLKKDMSNFVYNLAVAQTSCRVIIKFKSLSSTSGYSGYPGLLGDQLTSEPATYSVGGYFTSSKKVSLRVCQSNNTGINLVCENALNDSTWYYVVAYVDVANNLYVFSLYDDAGTLIEQKSSSINGVKNNTSGTYTRIGGINQNDTYSGNIDLSELCFLIDETPVWGELNSKTKTMGIPTN